jgi:hypothetical protein
MEKLTLNHIFQFTTSYTNSVEDALGMTIFYINFNHLTYLKYEKYKKKSNIYLKYIM